jgi:ABC-type multidrug transport system fused ATPase/permease subunit
VLFFICIAYPFVLIGIAILLVFRLGWWGLLCIAIPLAILPITGSLGNNSGNILKELNVYKDKRIKTTSEIIEGIRFIKLYGW